MSERSSKNLRASSNVVAEHLRNQTSYLVNSFQTRVSMLRKRYDIQGLSKHLSQDNVHQIASEIFGEGRHLAVGIDGSMDYDERLEMLLFYICVTGYRCPFEVSSDRFKFELEHLERDSKLSASTAIPLWVEDASNLTDTDETDLEFEKFIERIPFSIMTMSELYLALNAAKSGRVKLIFLDRPLFGTFSHLSRDLRVLLRRGTSQLVDTETSVGNLTLLDLYLASTVGPGEIFIPKRGPYLRHAILQILLKENKISREELARRLELKDVKELDKVIKVIVEETSRYGGRLFERCDSDCIKLMDGVKNYWNRVSEASDSIARKIFTGNGHSLQVCEGRWLTVLDLNTVSLFLMYSLLEVARRENILVIGITKDTTATDFTRAVLPWAHEHRHLTISSDLPNLKNDRAFLTIFSTVNSEDVVVPWRTISYDCCFTTIVKNKDNEAAFRAARKVISREQMFVKAYFQSRNFKSDSSVRSPVFVYDRFYNPNYDAHFISESTAIEWNKETTFRPFFEGSGLNPLDNLILNILSRCDNPEVLEALGHNQLLYLADKAVKFEVKAMRGMLRGVADLQLGTLARKEKVFSITRRFRDLRSESEMARHRRAEEAFKV